MISDADLERIAALAADAAASAAPELLRAFQQHAFMARISAGHDVFVEGQEVGAIPLLISGTVRVYQIGETGREVTLYRFWPSESCVLTASSIMTRRSFPAIATVEEDAEAVMIPAQTFRDWVGRDELWRGFFFDLVAQRLASVMTVVDEVAFQRLDQRVAALLLRRAASRQPSRDHPPGDRCRAGQRPRGDQPGARGPRGQGLDPLESRPDRGGGRSALERASTG